jgi:uracil-DNA glycosylase family 4
MINCHELKEKYFEYLLQSVHQCNLCSRMNGRKKVLSKDNGDICSKVLFIAEAPGRLGAECTGIPLYGDKTGNNFETLLSNIGWHRSEIFITNAILCNPQNDSGNNATPEKIEIANCNYYLSMTIALINPDVVVTLGAKALDALNLVCPHNFTLRENVATTQKWNNRILYPLYHTGPRAAIHRSLIQQRADFITLSHLVDPIKGLKKGEKTKISSTQSEVKPTCFITSTLVDMVTLILNELHSISFFKLTKLLYLIDYDYFEKFGKTISGGIYLRMQEGPWIPHLKDISKEYCGKLFYTRYDNRKPFLVSITNAFKISNLSDDEIDFVITTCEKYKNTSDANLKTITYLTRPMRYILAQEKEGRNMTKIPVLYQNKTALNIDEQGKKDIP